MKTKNPQTQRICRAPNCSNPLDYQKSCCSRACSILYARSVTTPEERKIYARQAAKIKFEKETSEQREIRIEASRQRMIAFNNSLTPEQKQELASKATAHLTPEQRRVNAQKGYEAGLANLTPEQKEEMDQLARERIISYNASLTPQERRENSREAGLARHRSWLRARSSRTPEGREWQARMLQSIQDEIDQLEREMLNGRKH